MIGTTLSHYNITRKFGSGGMGVVYEAVDTKLGRTVALKFLPPESLRDPDAKAASAPDHNNVCVIHEIGEAEDGQVFLAMTRYQGETLKEHLARGRPPINEALDVARQVAEGLAKLADQSLLTRTGTTLGTEAYMSPDQIVSGDETTWDNLKGLYRSI